MKISFAPFIATMALASSLGFDPRCPSKSVRKDDSLVIGFVAELRGTSDDRGASIQVGPMRLIASVREGNVSASDGSELHAGMKFWPLIPPISESFEVDKVSSLLDQMGEDTCVYHATFRGRTPATYSLLMNRQPRREFRPAREEEEALFYLHNKTCVVQGDYEPGTEPPCTRPILAAVSDFDRDGLLEFWATQPYLWDTGVNVWERKGSGFQLILETCVGCSD